MLGLSLTQQILHVLGDFCAKITKNNEKSTVLPQAHTQGSESPECNVALVERGAASRRARKFLP